MRLEEAINDLRSDEECSKCDYCPLAILIKLNPRTLEQHKMVEIYRWKLGEEGRPNLSWDKVYELWVSSGMAVKFANSYSEDKSFRQLKGELFGT